MKVLNKRDLALWLVSLTVVLASNLAGGTVDFVNLTATLLGATALIFMAKGSVWGQLLTIAFSILYGIASYRYHYWGEMITYLGMTLPMACVAAVAWLRHPTEKGKDEVAIQHLNQRQIVTMLLATAAVTLVLGILLVKLDTPNIVFSVLSVSTSFFAAYLTYLRSPWYAIAFVGNDIVLIILWLLATLDDRSNLPMVVNFAIFLVNDAYAFYHWRKRDKAQNPV